MKINVGSKNKNKLEAVSECILDYPDFKNAEIESIDVDVEEFGQPKTLEETVEGAVARAKKAYRNCNLSIGLESGIMPVPYTKTGYFEVSICAIFDGEKIHLGMSRGFEFPKKVVELMLNEGYDGSSAYKAAGFTEHQKIGEAQGIIADLTNGRVTRKDQIQDSIQMALIQLENPQYYL